MEVSQLNCDSLVSIALPEGLISIGNYAFVGATSLASASFVSRRSHLHRLRGLQGRHLPGVGLLTRQPHVHRRYRLLPVQLPAHGVRATRLLRRRFGVQ